MNEFEVAIERAEAALATTPETHPDRAAIQTDLANHLSTRYERLGAMGDLETAI